MGVGGRVRGGFSCLPRARGRAADHAGDGGFGAGGALIRLLDVNALVALAWPNHVHHARAIAWFTENRVEGWATCSVTEAGLVRVSSNARVIPDARPPREAIDLLVRMRQLPHHTFWSDDVSPTDADSTSFGGLVGHRKVTDAHLVTLAIRRGGTLATFDRGVLELAASQPGAAELIP